VEEPVQPNKDQPKPENVQVIEADESDDGVDGGEDGGKNGGIIGGLPDLGKAPPPPPPVVEKPRDVAPQALKSRRLEGEEQIQPPDEVRNQIRRDGKTMVTTVMKICINVGGGVSSVKQLKSSGYDAYDEKIKAKMRGWRYQPFTVNGKPAPVCSSVTFIYKQTN
jgi:TonB family protein